VSSIKRDSTLACLALCEDFLYGFKAARRAARAADTARTPTLPLTLPLRRRQRRSAGAKIRKQGPPLTYSSCRGSPRGPMLPLPDCPGPVRTRQGRLCPQSNCIRRAAWERTREDGLD
jgi:hypothetical protein